MPSNLLNVLPQNSQAKHSPGLKPQASRINQAEAYFERKWLIDAESMMPNGSIREMNRIERSWEAILEIFGNDLSSLQVVDIGCGSGELVKRLHKAGARVLAVDIALNALKHLPSGIPQKQDALPDTRLFDDFYDLVICTDVIADLAVPQHRLCMSELYRLLKPDAWVMISTSLDSEGEGALESFIDLISTEFKELRIVLSDHHWHRKVEKILEQANTLKQYCNEPEKRLKSQKIKGKFFYFITHPKLKSFWSFINYCVSPAKKLFSTNKTILLKLEKFCRFWRGNRASSHVITLGRRKTMMDRLEEKEKIDQRLSLGITEPS